MQKDATKCNKKMQKVHLYILSHWMALFFPRPKKYGTSQHLNLSASPMAAQPGRIVFGILGATLRLGGFGDGLELEGVLHHGPTAIHLLALGLLGGGGDGSKTAQPFGGLGCHPSGATPTNGKSQF